MVVSGNNLKTFIISFITEFAFSCQYCHTQLRLGSYSFDKDGQYGHKFFCLHHYGMQGELRPARITRKTSQRMSKENKSPEKKVLAGVAGVDLLDRGVKKRIIIVFIIHYDVRILQIQVMILHFNDSYSLSFCSANSGTYRIC